DLASLPNFRVDGGGGHDQSVQNDGQMPFELALLRTSRGNVLAGQVGEQIASLCGKVKMDRGAPLVAYTAHGASELATVDLGSAPRLDYILGQVGALRRLRIKLWIACEDEILNGFVTAFLLGKVAVLALAAIKEGPLEQQPAGGARRVLERGGFAALAFRL